MCTNPLKTSKDIDLCIEKLHKTGADTVISVQRLFDHHPIRIKKLRMIEFMILYFLRMKEQEARFET